MAQSLKQPTSQNFVQKTLGATLNAGANVMTLNNVTSIQNLPGVAIIDRIDSNSVETPTKREVISFTGTSGVTTVGVVKNADGSGTDQSHAVGAIVEFGPDILWAQSVIDGLTQVVVASTGLLDTTKVTDLTTAQVLTNKDLSSATNTLPTAAVTLTGTQTLTNKRITKRVVTTTDDSTAVINTDITDIYELSAVANATEFTLTGTPTNGQTLIVRLKDAGVGKGLTWTGFTAIGVTLPTTTVASKWHYVGCIYNSAATQWQAIAVVAEA